MNNTEKRFGEDTAAHFAGSQHAVDKDNRHFDDFRATLSSRELHFDLEGIAFEADLIQFDCLERVTLIADEAGCSIVNIDTQNETHILAGEITHQHAPHRPVHHIHSCYISTSDSQIRALIGTRVIEFEQILRIVTEVRVHLKDIIGFMLNGPFETGDISSSETLFARTLHNMHSPFVFSGHQAFHYRGGTIG